MKLGWVILKTMSLVKFLENPYVRPRERSFILNHLNPCQNVYFNKFMRDEQLARSKSLSLSQI